MEGFKKLIVKVVGLLFFQVSSSKIDYFMAKNNFMEKNSDIRRNGVSATVHLEKNYQCSFSIMCESEYLKVLALFGMMIVRLTVAKDLAPVRKNSMATW